MLPPLRKEVVRDLTEGVYFLCWVDDNIGVPVDDCAAIVAAMVERCEREDKAVHMRGGDADRCAWKSTEFFDSVEIVGTDSGELHQSSRNMSVHVNTGRWEG